MRRLRVGRVRVVRGLRVGRMWVVRGLRVGCARVAHAGRMGGLARRLRRRMFHVKHLFVSKRRFWAIGAVGSSGRDAAAPQTWDFAQDAVP